MPLRTPSQEGRTKESLLVMLPIALLEQGCRENASPLVRTELKGVAYAIYTKLYYFKNIVYMLVNPQLRRVD